MLYVTSELVAALRAGADGVAEDLRPGSVLVRVRSADLSVSATKRMRSFVLRDDGEPLTLARFVIELRVSVCPASGRILSAAACAHSLP